MPKGNLSKLYDEGVIYLTYSLLVHSSKALKETNAPLAADNVVHHIPKGSRLQQIVDWLRSGKGDPLIVRTICTSYPPVFKPRTTYTIDFSSTHLVIQGCHLSKCQRDQLIFSAQTSNKAQTCI